MAFSIIGPKDFLLSVYSVIEHNAHQAVNQNTEGSKIVRLRLSQYRLWVFQVFIRTSIYVYFCKIHENMYSKKMYDHTFAAHFRTFYRNILYAQNRKAPPQKKIRSCVQLSKRRQKLDIILEDKVL